LLEPFQVESGNGLDSRVYAKDLVGVFRFSLKEIYKRSGLVSPPIPKQSHEGRGQPTFVCSNHLPFKDVLIVRVLWIG
jgi:hypothetical protein